MTEASIQTTPLHALHVEIGARMGPFAGYNMPIQFPAGVLAEHLHTRKAAGLFDVSHMGQALIEGADHAAVASFLESICPADILNLARGRQRYTQLLNENGGIVDDLMVTRPPGAEGTLRLVVNASRKEVDFALMSERLPADLRLMPLPEAALIALQGPSAARTLGRLEPGHGLEAMGFMSARPARLGEFEIFVSRSGYTGEDGYEISLPSTQAESFARILLDQPEVAPIGLGARDSLDSKLASASMGTNSTRQSTRSKPGFPGQFKNVDGSRAASPAPSGFRTRWQTGPTASAWGCDRTDARRRARARRSFRPMAPRLAPSPPAGSGRASAARSRWAMSREATRRLGPRSVSWCVASH